MYKLVFASLLSAMLLFGEAFAGNSATAASPCECKIKTSAFSWMCKNKIEKKLKETPGVSECYVSMKDKVATVSFDKEKITGEQILKKIQEMGYEAEFAADSSSKTTTTTPDQPAPH